MIACPTCGAENPDGAKFCNACGTPLEPERTASQGAQVRDGAVRRPRRARPTLAEQEDPEVVQSVVGRTFDRLAEEIERYEGLLEKFMGDAVLAVFGVPRAHEDDAERAVRAALEMQAVLSELNRGFAAEGKPTLEMRIGIEAGEVLVDVERASGPRDRMLTGDAVNTAARLQSAGRTRPDRGRARPCTRRTKDVIEYRELEPLTLKGKAEPVPAWQALRIKARTRGERPRLGLESRLVGRDEELAVLKQTLRRVETEGRPALVTVIGPAGVGKSRLVAELERYVEGLPADRVLASRPVPRVRQHLVLGARRRDQGAVRDLRGRHGRGRREEGGRRRARAVRRRERGAADPRARRRRRGPRDEPRGPVRGLAAVPRAAWRRGTRWCSSSTTSTGPTRGCSTSSSTSPTGRRDRS